MGISYFLPGLRPVVVGWVKVDCLCFVCVDRYCCSLMWFVI